MIGTVGPLLSESPLSKPSVMWTLFCILKSQKTVWFSGNKWMLVWFLDLLGLLYHTTVGRKDTLAHAILSVAYAVD